MTAEQTATEQATDKRNLRKVRQGIVTSNKMQKTITVTVEYKEKPVLQVCEAHPEVHRPR